MSALLALGIADLDVTTLIWAGVIMAQIIINIVVLVVLGCVGAKGNRREKASDGERAEVKKALKEISQKIDELKAQPAQEIAQSADASAEHDELKGAIADVSEKVSGLYAVIAAQSRESEPEKKAEPNLAIFTFKEGASVTLSVPEGEEGEKNNEEDYIWYVNGEQRLKGRVLRVEEGFAEGEYQVRVCCNDVPVNLIKLVIEHEEKSEEAAVALAAPVKKQKKEQFEEESAEGGTLRYNRSFTARIIQSDDAVKHWYTLLKNELLTYNKVKARMSWKKETFRVSGSALEGGGEAQTVARLSHRGKTLCLFLPLDPKDYADTKYKIESAGKTASYAETPCLYRIKNEKRMRYALELIDAVMEKLGVKRIERESEDFYVPYEGTVELIEKGLIKRVIKSKEDEAIFEDRD